MSLTDDATDLFARALAEGRNDLASALAPFTDFPKLLIAIGNRENFDWKKHASLLVRERYSSDECDRLIRADLFKQPGYQEALSYAISKLSDSKSLHALFSRLMRAGHHRHALELAKQVKDKSLLKSELERDFHFWSRQRGSKTGALFAIGHGSSMTIDTLRVFEEIDVDLPPFLSPAEYNNSGYGTTDEWKPERFKLQVELVAETLDKCGCHAPVLELGYGSPMLKNSALAKGFLAEYGRAQKLGGWHAQNFPDHLPLLIEYGQIDAAQRLGLHLLKPIYEIQAENSEGEIKTYPTHGFSSVDGLVTDEQILMSTSFLSLNLVQLIRDGNLENKILALAPAWLVPALEMDAESPDSELLLALRNHRPEPLRLAQSNELSLSDRLDTQLYLRGIPSVHRDPNNRLHTLSFHKGLVESTAYLKLLNSSLERQWVYDAGHPWRGHDKPQYLLIDHDNSKSHQENLAQILDNIKIYQEHLGGGFSHSIRAPFEFFEYVAAQRIGLELDVRCIVTDVDHKDERQGLFGTPRLRASLGHEYRKNIELCGDSPEDWLNKAVRSKDVKIQNICLGLLDRYPLEEVAKLATTPARANFLMENYELSKVVDNLPKKARALVVDQKLKIDLGL